MLRAFCQSLAQVNAIDWSPNGNLLAIGCADTVFVVSGDAGNLGDVIGQVNSPGVRYDVAFSPDSRRLVYAVSIRRIPGPVAPAKPDFPGASTGPLPRPRRPFLETIPRAGRNNADQDSSDAVLKPAKPPGAPKGAPPIPWPIIFVDVPASRPGRRSSSILSSSRDLTTVPR